MTIPIVQVGDTEEEKRAWAITCACMLLSGRPDYVDASTVKELARNLLHYRKFGFN